MNTLIELYDERAIENILAADMFRPQHIVYLLSLIHIYWRCD